MNGPQTIAALAALIFMVATVAQDGKQNAKIEQLQVAVEVQDDRADMYGRQLAQLNGRVFLGTDIPDTESGKQP